ncbi:MAG: HoxN/HupN/NixA family nickel/cobalt transporter [Nocardioidaceae bacterium]
MSSEAIGIEAVPRWRRSVTRPEWLTIAGMTVVVVGLHLVGWLTLTELVAPRHFSVGNSAVFGVGLGVTAYTLGMRHAFDADHIAAIDNTTRKLLADGKRPVSVGFWFSLGHSTVVFALCVLLALGIRSVAGGVENQSSGLHGVMGLVGTLVSGTFLYILGILNLVILVGVVRVFRDMRRGKYDEASLEARLDSRGFMNRFLGGLTKSVSRPWQIYPIGILFGLGFDTATEVGLLLLAGGAAAFDLPWYAILCLPVLFAAGMSLLDSADGLFMRFAYGWAFSRPVRKVYYNIAVTTLSVAVALIIGTIELLSIAADQLSITRGPIAWVAGLDLNHVGFMIVGLFVVTWLGALAVWRFGRIEDRWSAQLARQ